MSPEAWLKQATEILSKHKIETARLDSLILLEDELNTNRTQLLAGLEKPLTDEQLRRLDDIIAKRARHTPLAYLRGHTEFYGREFLVNRHVLVPRPESEVMIEQLLQLRLKQHSKLADIGSGSGALGITAALELGLDEVYLHDIDHTTLEVAKSNAERYKVNAKCIQKNLINGYNTKYDVLLCNLPYVPVDHPLNEAAKLEPKLALFGGKDGLDLYRELFGQLIEQANIRPLYVLTESLPAQHIKLTRIATAAGYEQQVSQDFIQVFKFAV